MSTPSMETGRRAAIESDNGAAASKEIGKITAHELLTHLEHEGLGSASLSLLPEKKKYELYVEPEWNPSVKLGDIARVLKAEKKKVELEVPLDFGRYGYPAQRAGGGGGSVGYPTDDQTRLWPPQIEMRKASLDHRFDVVATQIAQLQVTMQELGAKLERAIGR